MKKVIALMLLTQAAWANNCKAVPLPIPGVPTELVAQIVYSDIEYPIDGYAGGDPSILYNKSPDPTLGVLCFATPTFDTTAVTTTTIASAWAADQAAAAVKVAAYNTELSTTTSAIDAVLPGSAERIIQLRQWLGL